MKIDESERDLKQQTTNPEKCGAIHLFMRYAFALGLV